jgi:asparagine synthase (glutamine-hydrolysing)
MSGICGLLNLDGKPVDGAEIAVMTAMLKRRGPGGVDQWTREAAGLGHALLATTPELEAESQPFVHAESGCVISADVRLDNRDQLASKLAPGRPRDSIGDAELILLSYLRWGDECTGYLLGDFAFVIHDSTRERLFCARDHSGMRLLYYYHDPRRQFAVATSPRAILVLPGVPYAVNEARIADFLVEQLEWIDYTSTFFDEIYRLPPGHRLSIDRKKLTITEYWAPSPGPNPGIRSDDDWREGFLEVLTTAVEARLCRSPRTAGSMLSGGMDSGSVVAIGKDLLTARKEGPLHTYSANTDSDPGRDDFAEIRAIEAATAMDGIAPTLINPRSLEGDLQELVANCEEPFDAQCTLLKSVYRAAAADHRRVVLDGAGGDVVLGEGTYIQRLLRRGRLISAFREISLENRFWESDYFWRESWGYIRSALAPQFIKRYRRRRVGPIIEKAVQNSLISAEFATQIELGARIERMQQLFSGSATADYAVERCQSIRPNMTAGRERYARLAAGEGVEASDPFMDKRVIDFCSQMPGHLRLNNGWPKAILRDIMRERLPVDVVEARGKHHLGWVFNDAVSGAAVKSGAASLGALQTALAGYVDSAKLSDMWRKSVKDNDLEQIHTAYVLSIWLRENENRPVVTD